MKAHKRHLHAGKTGFFSSALLLGFLVVVLGIIIAWSRWKDQQTSWQETMLSIVIPEDIRMKEYFQQMGKLVADWDSILPYDLDEYVLVRHNAWVMDSLASKDYYRLKEKGITCLNQPDRVVLRKGDSLHIPDQQQAQMLREKIKNTRIDINIPQFKLHILENDSLLFAFDIRVGKRDTQYLELAGRTVDLRTRTGVGKIIRINRDPLFIDPVNKKPYYYTTRDDGRRTRLPVAPWLEPEINGKRWGQLIHPTTNLRTLGKPASHGCIGTREGDIWYIYYFAPLNTPVTIRYDLFSVSESGDTVFFRDIYQK